MSMCSYNQYSYKFHFFNSNGITFLVFCDASYDDKLAFDFLEKINRLFIDKFSKEQIDNAISYSLRDSFNPVMKEQMDYYNNNTHIKTLTEQLKDAIIEQKNVIFEASDVLSQRGEKMDLIVKKADQLSQDSNSFMKAAKKIKRNEQCKQIKYTIIIVIAILIIAYVVFAFVCEGPTFPNCFNK